MPNLVAEVFSLPGGKYVLRSKGTEPLQLTEIMEVIRQVDGSFVLQPKASWITLEEAAQILECDYSSLYRRIDLFDKETGQPFLTCRKRLPGRIEVTLDSVMEAKARRDTDIEFWDRFKSPASQLNLL